MPSHARIGIQHAPVEISFSCQLLEAATALTHLFHLIFIQSYARLFSHPITPFTGKEGLHCHLVFQMIAHHVSVFRGPTYLFIEHIIIRFCFLMAVIICRGVHLVARIFIMSYSIYLLHHLQWIICFIQGRFPQNHGGMITVSPYHLTLHLIQAFRKDRIVIEILPTRYALYHQ